MKIKGTSVGLSSTTTQHKTATAVWVANSNATIHKTVTLQNSDDDTIGTLVVPALGGVVIHLEVGQGLRGDTDLLATQVDSNSGR